ncbi:MAG TPA: VapE domain-containing protein, partial [Nitrososphaera sp.]|nr:VapE domain-containing protein [Nitrososphaera sp.]
LDATTRRADVSALKDIITKRDVTVRKAYGQYDTTKPALASFIGTVNDSTGFLTDDTGNRRFLVASIDSIDWSYQQLDRDQLWAEALAAYRSGVPWQPLPHERAAQDEQNKLHEVESLWDGWISSYFYVGGLAVGHRMTASEIVDVLRTRYDIRPSGSARQQAMEIARVLKRLGARQVRTKAWRGYEDVLPK